MSAENSRRRLRPVAGDVRFGRLVEQLCRHGSRPVTELLVQLGAERMCRTEIDILVKRYVASLEAIGPETLRAVGGDRMAPTPIHRIHDRGGDDP